MLNWQPEQFLIMDFLTSYRYKTILSVHLMCNWPQIFTRSLEWVEVFSTCSFWTIVLSSCWLHHQIRQKTPPKRKKKAGSKMCVASLLGVPAGGQFLVLLYCVLIRLDGKCYTMRIVAHSFLWSHGAKKKVYFKNVYFWLWKKVNECRNFPRCCVNIIIFLEKYMKNEF